MSHRRLGERGAAAVEMALVLPLLILLLGGIIDFGRLFFQQVILTNAAREGARAAVVLGDPTIRALAASNGINAGDRVSPYPKLTGDDCATTPTGSVTVETRARFTYYFVNILPGVSNPTTLQASATMGCV